MLCLFNGILLSNEMEQNIDPHYFESQNNHADWKSLYTKQVHTVWFPLHKILKMPSNL